MPYLVRPSFLLRRPLGPVYRRHQPQGYQTSLPSWSYIKRNQTSDYGKCKFTVLKPLLGSYPLLVSLRFLDLCDNQETYLGFFAIYIHLQTITIRQHVYHWVELKYRHSMVCVCHILIVVLIIYVALLAFWMKFSTSYWICEYANAKQICLVIFTDTIFLMWSKIPKYLMFPVDDVVMQWTKLISSRVCFQIFHRSLTKDILGDNY